MTSVTSNAKVFRISFHFQDGSCGTIGYFHTKEKAVEVASKTTDNILNWDVVEIE